MPLPRWMRAVVREAGQLDDVLKVDADEDGVGGDDTADGLPKPATIWMPEVLKPLRGT